MNQDKEIYLIRHAEKDDRGTLTDSGREAATSLGKRLPTFSTVISSESGRAQETAELLTGQKARVDARAGYYMAHPEKSNELNRIAKEQDIPFLEAVIIFNDSEVLEGVKDKAEQLNDLIEELMQNLPVGAKAIIVSHDLSISPAMKERGVPLESIPYLSGYVIDTNGNISTFTP